jgi:hypothetical protein
MNNSITPPDVWLQQSKEQLLQGNMSPLYHSDSGVVKARYDYLFRHRDEVFTRAEAKRLLMAILMRIQNNEDLFNLYYQEYNEAQKLYSQYVDKGGSRRRTRGKRGKRGKNRRRQSSRRT